ncbi:Homeobox-leucine zipper protein [Quillaja saponaria]|uniref:Homeobox-leucine zipper protein n=1 Tax=Quillaja saponaria TaxID=32244 RepID=A0AAD7LUB4_QUISA|nr:Homeobox-leucine zipper protein [Quillaja saponaria]
MDFMMGSGGGSGDEHESSGSRNGRKSHHRHTPLQIQQLEEFFKEYPHPDENQRRQLSRVLGLEPRQVKFWFQNKRTQTKAQIERADNNVIRADNERIQCENLAIIEALKNAICPSCGGPPFGEQERQHILQKLKMENAHLKQEHERVSNLLSKYIGKPIPQLELTPSAPGSPIDLSPGTSFNQRMGSPTIDQDIASGSTITNNTAFAYQLKGITDMEKELMVEIAASAMDELIKLLRINDPLWVKSAVDGRLVLHRDSYEEIFARANNFRNSSARVESSKESGIVTMCGMQLVDMFLDSDQWVNLFPTIVTKAKTIHVLENGLSGNRTGALQLMYEQMHILSPLVPPRDFCFLRHCQQVELGTWVIVDVSCDSLQENISPSCCRRLPSGCMIHEMPNGFSRVTWVEHVEVDDKNQTHRLYRDLVCSSIAYGAERWVFTLQRIAERLAYFMGNNSPSHEPGGVISSPEARRSIMKLGHRMVKSFCGILNMSGKLDFPQLSEVNNSGVRISVHKNTEPGQPGGAVVSAATSLWLPLPPQNVFDFLKDKKTRAQWDVLSDGNPVQEIAHISNGSHPGNCISIIRPFIPTEKSMLIFQECYTDPLGSLVIYAPIDVAAINIAIRGEDSFFIPILPSGFVISGDGRPKTGAGVSTSTSTGRSCGSLLTVAFQILISNPSSTKRLNVETVATVNTLISSTVQRIKSSLNICGL